MIELNRIYNVDCLEGIKQIPSSTVDLIVTDPPYFLGMTHNGKKGEFLDLAIARPFYLRLFTEYRRVLKSTGHAFMFCDWRSYAFYYPIFVAALKASNLIVWDKVSGPGSYYGFFHELIIFHCGEGGTFGGSNIWRHKGFSAGAKKTDGEKVHPTQKPKEIIERIIKYHSVVGAVVLDTFIGSGTTALVAKQLNRNFIGFELNPEYIRLAEQRLKGC